MQVVGPYLQCEIIYIYILTISVIPNRPKFLVNFKVFTNVTAGGRTQPFGPEAADP